MKRKINLSVVLLLSVLIFTESLPTSIKADAYGGLICPNGHHGFPQRYVYNTTYPNADNYAHQLVYVDLFRLTNMLEDILQQLL